MKLAQIYWISIAVLTVIHLEFTGQATPFHIPIYIPFILVGGLTFFISRKVVLHIQQLGDKVNLQLYSLQILILIIYISLEPSWGVFIPFLLFIGVEVFRHKISRQLFRTQHLLDSQAQKIDQMNETFLVVRKERHDFLKHISALHYMLENKQYHEAENYVDELVEGYKETNLSIQGERGTVAGVLHQNYQAGKEKGIEVIYDLETAISSLPLTDHDTVALIGNIIGNAIDASSEWQNEKSKQAHITLQTYKRSGLFILNCKNDTLPLPNEVLDHLFTKKATSTKSGDHAGLGTQIIADIVNRYGGHLDYTYKNETFTLHIKLPAFLK